MRKIFPALVLLFPFIGQATPFVPPLPTENAAETLSVYRDAAVHGAPHAMLTLGHYNEYGIGMPINRDEAVKWYRKICGLCGLLQAEIQEEAARGLERLAGFGFPFDPRTADGNTMLDFIAAQTNITDAILANRLLRQKTLGRTLVFTNLVAFYVQRYPNGDIRLTLSHTAPRDQSPAGRRHPSPPRNNCSSVQALFTGEAAKSASHLDREDVVSRIECVVVTNNLSYWGFVVKGVSQTPRDAFADQPLPPFDADKITGDELLDYLHRQPRPVRKWQFIDIQSRLTGRRLTFHNLRLSSSCCGTTRWIDAYPRWESLDGGDRPGLAKIKLSFADKATERFAMDVFGVSCFAPLDEVTGTFADVRDPDDGWALQLENVALRPTGMLEGLDTAGEGTVNGDELVRKVGANFTAIERFSIDLQLKGRELAFTAGVVESCRPCWTNGTLSLTCRLSALARDNHRQTPFRVTFEVPAEKAKSLRRTPIPGDLVLRLKGRLAAPEPIRQPPYQMSGQPILTLENPDFDISWQTDVAATTGLDSRPGERILRRLSLCWPAVRTDQLIRLAREANGREVEFPRGRVQQSTYSYGARTLVVKLEDPLYGDCISLPLDVNATLDKKADMLKSDALLRHIRGILTFTPTANGSGTFGDCGVRLKDATFEIIER